MSYVGVRRRPERLRRGLPLMLAVAVLAAVALSASGLLPWLRGIDDAVPGGRAPAGGGAGPGTSTSATAAAAGDSGAAGVVPGTEVTATTFGRWSYPNGNGPVLGTAGPVLRYRVAVEQTLPVTVAEFTGLVDATLGDPRSWIAGRDVRLRRVPGAAAHDFTIYLAAPDTAFDLCGQGGLDIRENGVPYTSCRVGDLVVLNADRYRTGVPNYGAPLADYRRYMINHEVGHRLGTGHMLCPGAGRPAPVMEQQTLGLQGCVANSWPYIDGRLYTGPATDAL